MKAFHLRGLFVCLCWFGHEGSVSMQPNTVRRQGTALCNPTAQPKGKGEIMADGHWFSGNGIYSFCKWSQLKAGVRSWLLNGARSKITLKMFSCWV